MFSQMLTPGPQPQFMSRKGVVAAAHYLGSSAGLQVLIRGGNAIDAGVAGGLTLNVVNNDMCTFSGVAPIIIYLARERKVVSLAGIGWWPAAIRPELFAEDPLAIRKFPLHHVVPGAPDAWITALRDWGTITFEEAVSYALEMAEDGFAFNRSHAETFGEYLTAQRTYPENARIFLRDGELPPVGTRIIQKELANTFRRLIDVERANASRGRHAALTAVRDYIYKGPIAREMVDFDRSAGGVMTVEDFAAYQVRYEQPYSVDYKGNQVYSCGPWCQGPVLLQALNLLEGFDLKRLGHNSPEYLHKVLEALKLSFADREAYYGDPLFNDVPMNALLDKGYAAQRAALIGETAHMGMYPAGAVSGRAPIHMMPDEQGKPLGPEGLGVGAPSDTSYICVADAEGNLFSATPSDGYVSGPIVPGLGLHISERGGQGWVDPRNPNGIAPHKRPRLTPNPSLVLKGEKPYIAFGTPGNDRQPQVMLQVLLNMLDFGMLPQEAIEQPRVASFSFTSTTAPHTIQPGLVKLEDTIPHNVADALSARGHVVEYWAYRSWMQSGTSAVLIDPATGFILGGSDPRRETGVAGW